MDGRPTCTDCDEAGDYVVPNVLSPRDLVFRPDNMEETVPHTYITSDRCYLNLIILLVKRQNDNPSPGAVTGGN